jgi:hypothetical protein
VGDGADSTDDPKGDFQKCKTAYEGRWVMEDVKLDKNAQYTGFLIVRVEGDPLLKR